MVKRNPGRGLRRSQALTGTIAVTPGEPAGIGPDLIVKLAQLTRKNDIRVVADPDLLLQRAELMGLPLHICTNASASRQAGEISVNSVPLSVPVKAGTLNPGNARYVLQCLDAAITGCLAGNFSAMVTGPVQKSVINDAGIPFTGHTEYLAQACHVEHVVMMLATDAMRVALATVHLPLSQVPSNISRSGLERTIKIIHADLKRYFGIEQPRFLVCGLNPHAGESGHLGSEEIERIEPACQALREEGLDIRGPLPADSLFTPEMLNKADVVLAMYHDQGLPVLKYQGFGQAVNITLGLPIIRTSVDHGTALDLAGSGKAGEQSLLKALSMAEDLVAHASQSEA